MLAHVAERDLLAAEMEGVLANNREWGAQMLAQDPEFFHKLVSDATPSILWIGCADSRVPANELLGLPPGEVFVQRNVGNLASHKDLNCQSCLEYAVDVLKVRHIIVCGHYNCGAVRAALHVPCKAQGMVNLWLQDIRATRDEHIESLRRLRTEARVDRLVELNVMRQVTNVCRSPVVQAAWDRGQQLAVHGMAYRLEDGVLQELTRSIACLDDLEQYMQAQSDRLRQYSLSVLHNLRNSFECEALRSDAEGARCNDQPPAVAKAAC